MRWISNLPFFVKAALFSLGWCLFCLFAAKPIAALSDEALYLALGVLAQGWNALSNIYLHVAFGLFFLALIARQDTIQSAKTLNQVRANARPDQAAHAKYTSVSIGYFCIVLLLLVLSMTQKGMWHTYENPQLFAFLNCFFLFAVACFLVDITCAERLDTPKDKPSEIHT